jgi:hypothetical protein
LLLALWQTLSGVESNEAHSAHLAATGSQVVQQRPQDAGDKLDEAAVALSALRETLRTSGGTRAACSSP